MADLLVFSTILSSSPLFAAAGAAADCLAMEFVVDHWVIRRGLLDGVEDQSLSSFLVFGWCYGRPFSLVYFPYLMANEENQFLTIIIKLWKSDGVLEMPPFSASSTTPREEGKMTFPRQPFSLFFLNHFEPFGVVLTDLSPVNKWAGLPFFFWVLDLVDGFRPFPFTFWLPWTTRLDGLWTSGRLLGCWTWSAMGQKKGPLHLAPLAQIARDVWFG